ncbi:PadR family transcriptional regulator [Nonomuraea sp. NPDC050556]|uniref:PadR family transcriptional regulator n=1 Tax=Nonomuraea sp. NPDC050556 TaxID=3364369 RepID=UPI0037B504F9
MVSGTPLALTVLSLLQYKPMHPYGMQRVIKQWGKDQVVNVGQRSSLYRTIERLAGGGLIAVRETERDQQYPERTVYEITASGRAAAREWLLEMLRTPRQEYPQFPAALSHLLMLPVPEIVSALGERLETVSGTLRDMDANLAAQASDGLPRISMLEFEYLREMTAAEVAWLRGVVGDLEAGRLAWTAEELERHA